MASEKSNTQQCKVTEIYGGVSDDYIAVQYTMKTYKRRHLPFQNSNVRRKVCFGAILGPYQRWPVDLCTPYASSPPETNTFHSRGFFTYVPGRGCPGSTPCEIGDEIMIPPPLPNVGLNVDQGSLTS